MGAINLGGGSGKGYKRPDTGIPITDLAQEIQDIINNATGGSGGAGVFEWKADTEYAKNSLIAYDGKLYLVLADFITGPMFAYNTAYLFLVSTKTTGSSVQFWNPFTNYKVDDMIYFNSMLYRMNKGIQSGASFDSTDMTLVVTNHNATSGIQGPGIDYFHLTSDKNLIVGNLTDTSGKLSYKGVVSGDMITTVYDKNNDGIVDKAETLLGLTVSVGELNSLQGATVNMQSQIDALSKGIVFQGEKATYADVEAATTVFEGASYIVIADENHGGLRTYYVYNTGAWFYMGPFDVKSRNFYTEPLNLSSEVFNTLPASYIDNAIARKTELHNHTNKALLDTYSNSNTDITNAITKAHEHLNLFVLNKVSEDGSGNLLYNGQAISGSGVGTVDLSNFTTDDLVDYPNKRYVTDLEKIDIAKISGINTSINNLSATVTAISGKLPLGISGSNPLLMKSDLTTSFMNLKFADLADVSTITNDEMLIVDISGNITSRPIDSAGISSIVDDKTNSATNVKKMIFNKATISQVGDEVTISPNDLFSIDLIDMPKDIDFVADGFLVADFVSKTYKQRNISDFTSKLINKGIAILSTDWISENSYFVCELNHGLKTENIIANAYINKIKVDIGCEIINEDVIKLTTNAASDMKIVINASQGVIGIGGGTGGTATVTTDMFIDDLRSRIDRAYSSSKVTTLLNDYMKKSNAYSKIETDNKYATINLQHSHTSLVALNKITEVDNEMYYNGNKVMVSLNPTTSTLSFNENKVSLELLVDTSQEMNTSGIKMINNAQLLIANTLVSTNNPYLPEDYVQLIISEGNITILDVKITPGESQQYVLGISPNVKVSAKGKFAANYVLTGF